MTNEFDFNFDIDYALEQSLNLIKKECITKNMLNTLSNEPIECESQNIHVKILNFDNFNGLGEWLIRFISKLNPDQILQLNTPRNDFIIKLTEHDEYLLPQTMLHYLKYAIDNDKNFSLTKFFLIFQAELPEFYNEMHNCNFERGQFKNPTFQLDLICKAFGFTCLKNDLWGEYTDYTDCPNKYALNCLIINGDNRESEWKVLIPIKQASTTDSKSTSNPESTSTSKSTSNPESTSTSESDPDSDPTSDPTSTSKSDPKPE